jgi:hypothetical protein
VHAVPGPPRLRALQRMADESLPGRPEGVLQQKLNPAPLPAQPVVQGYFTYGHRRFDSAAAVLALLEKSQLSSADLSKRIRRGDKTAEKTLDERWQAVQDMADSPVNQGHAGDVTALKNLAANYVSQHKVLAAGFHVGEAGAEQGVSASNMAATGDLTGLREDLKPATAKLLKSPRAFPDINIAKVAKKAMGMNGHGFQIELELAASLLDNRNVMVQVGVVPPQDLPHFLGFDPAESSIKPKGFVGGDVAVWENPAAAVSGRTTFIQSKSANAATVKENVEAAANQLAGLTASGEPAGKDAEREFTLTGRDYEGAIYVALGDDVDARNLVKIADGAFGARRDHVKRVVYRYPDGTYFEVTPADPKASGKDRGTFSKTNPLLRPLLPDADDEKSAARDEEADDRGGGGLLIESGSDGESAAPKPSKSARKKAKRKDKLAAEQLRKEQARPRVPIVPDGEERSGPEIAARREQDPQPPVPQQGWLAWGLARLGALADAYLAYRG